MKRGKKGLFLIGLWGSTVFYSCKGDKEVSKEKEKIFQEIAETSMKTLMPYLMQKVKQKVEEGSYKEAVSFCNQNALSLTQEKVQELWQKIANKYNLSYLELRRVSFKFRNPKNKPDEIEKEILKEWELDIRRKKKPSFTYRKKGDLYYLAMPIYIISPLCLKCHGQEKDLDKEAYKVIKKLYPLDKATGYKLNDLRGAFITKVSFRR